MHSNNNDVEIPIEALIVSKINGSFPEKYIDCGKTPIAFCELADSHFQYPAGVDLLLGAGVCSEITQPSIVKFTDNSKLLAQKTTLGYVIYGQTNDVGIGKCSFHVALPSREEDSKLDEMLLQYWNADEIPSTRKWTALEELVEDNFVKTFERNSDGRFVVTIPRKPDAGALGNSYRLAMACFLNVEKKLQRLPDLKAKYKEVMNDYINSGHMVQVEPFRHVNDGKAYYMPHHPINYGGKTNKGKFRIVYNASAASSSGISFNDQQLPGPKLQPDLIEIFLKFRLKRFAMTADIKQMFRQVRISPSEWNYQRIFWREEPTLPLREYIITVVSWGMASAGFNSVRALRQCAIDGGSKYAVGAEIALNDFYFDDMLSGAHSEMDLLKAQAEVSKLLATGGFELAKWATNSKMLSNRIINTDLDVPLECGLLGMKWNTITDSLRLKTDAIGLVSAVLTKRVVISAISKVYDPSGLVLPVIVTGKILQQNIWRVNNLGWDDELPRELKAQWTAFECNLKQLGQIEVPRWLGMCPEDDLELHIFCDASELAMGVVAHLVSRSANRVAANIITSRSKVAPLKKLTIPCLELSAAVMGAKLAPFIQRAFKLSSLQTYFWTDSQIVIHWLNRVPHSLEPFVANRVSVIQELTHRDRWNHISGVENPADLLTRGATTEELIASKIWWNGPSWLQVDKSQWKVNKSCKESLPVSVPLQCNILTQPSISYKSKKGKPIMRVFSHSITITTVSADGEEHSLLNKISNLAKLLRVTAYVQRFIRNIKRNLSKEIGIPRLTILCEYRQALLFWIAHTQRLFYTKEIDAVLSNKPVERSSSLAKLTPTLIGDGLLRMTGRLENSLLPFNTKHPIILPPQSRLSHLLVLQTHLLTLHGGPQLVIAQLRKTYWINRLRQVSKGIIHRCIKCVRFRQTAAEQLMGQLPPERVTIGEAFARTGVDFAGPFTMTRAVGRPTRGSDKSTEKAWLSIFVCLASRAVHVEVLCGLTVCEFLSAFERFIMRKGRCFHLYSDNGTTFIGTDNELARTLKEWSTSFPAEKLHAFNTQWNFITPAAPFKGGIWEAAVKSFKFHLRRIVGGQSMTKDALTQVAVQIEGCLNSRPLWPSSDDPSDLHVVTPADLFIGKPIISQPLAEYVVNVPQNRLSWWQQRQKMHQKLWQLWQDNYLTSLQTRGKWFSIQNNIKIDDMVIVRDDNLPPTQWCVGRIVKTYPGKDGLVRSVRVKTVRNELDRPITKICLLVPPKCIQDPIRARGGGESEPNLMDTE